MASWSELLAVDSKNLYDLYSQVPTHWNEIWSSQRRLNRELTEFASFYRNHNYGPFATCYGHMSDRCDCEAFQNMTWGPDQGPGRPTWENVSFSSTFKEPGRKQFIRIVSQNSFSACFDLSTPRQFEAIAN